MTDHTVKAFTEKLEALSASGRPDGRPGRGAVRRRHRGHRPARHQRSPRARSAATSASTQLQHDIEDRALKLLALRQPMAVDLRETLAAIKIASELERIGDLAKNIAKRAIVLNREPPIRLTQSLARMGKQALAPAQAGAGRLFRPRRRGRRSGVEPGRRDRRDLQQPVPRAAHLHDGRSAHHRAVHASSVHRQEHRAQRRSRHQHRRGRLSHGARRPSGERAGPRPTPPAKPACRSSARA